MTTKARVAGVGMIPFTKPGQSEDWDVMAEKAVRLALADAGIGYELIQQAYAGYVYGDSTAGQSALYRVGITGIPIVNVNNNCSTGSTALYLARQMVELGAASSQPWISACLASCRSRVRLRSLKVMPRAPGSICSKPTASTQSAAPSSTICRAR